MEEEETEEANNINISLVGDSYEKEEQSTRSSTIEVQATTKNGEQSSSSSTEYTSTQSIIFTTQIHTKKEEPMEEVLADLPFDCVDPTWDSPNPSPIYEFIMPGTSTETCPFSHPCTMSQADQDLSNPSLIQAFSQPGTSSETDETENSSSAEASCDVIIPESPLIEMSCSNSDERGFFGAPSFFVEESHREKDDAEADTFKATDLLHGINTRLRKHTAQKIGKLIEEYGHMSTILPGTEFNNITLLQISGIHKSSNKCCFRDEGMVSMIIDNSFDAVDEGSLMLIRGFKSPRMVKETNELIAALQVNYKANLPVRVIRSFKSRQEFRPPKGYRYDGVYSVIMKCVSCNRKCFLLERNITDPSLVNNLQEDNVSLEKAWLDELKARSGTTDTTGITTEEPPKETSSSTNVVAESETNNNVESDNTPYSENVSRVGVLEPQTEDHEGTPKNTSSFDGIIGSGKLENVDSDDDLNVSLANLEPQIKDIKEETFPNISSNGVIVSDNIDNVNSDDAPVNGSLDNLESQVEVIKTEESPQSFDGIIVPDNIENVDSENAPLNKSTWLKEFNSQMEEETVETGQTLQNTSSCFDIIVPDNIENVGSDDSPLNNSAWLKEFNSQMEEETIGSGETHPNTSSSFDNIMDSGNENVIYSNAFGDSCHMNSDDENSGIAKMDEAEIGANSEGESSVTEDSSMSVELETAFVTHSPQNNQQYEDPLKTLSDHENEVSEIISDIKDVSDIKDNTVINSENVIKNLVKSSDEKIKHDEYLDSKESKLAFDFTKGLYSQSECLKLEHFDNSLDSNFILPLTGVPLKEIYSLNIGDLIKFARKLPDDYNFDLANPSQFMNPTILAFLAYACKYKNSQDSTLIDKGLSEVFGDIFKNIFYNKSCVKKSAEEGERDDSNISSCPDDSENSNIIATSENNDNSREEIAVNSRNVTNSEDIATAVMNNPEETSLITTRRTRSMASRQIDDARPEPNSKPRVKPSSSKTDVKRSPRKNTKSDKESSRGLTENNFLGFQNDEDYYVRNTRKRQYLETALYPFSGFGDQNNYQKKIKMDIYLLQLQIRRNEDRNNFMIGEDLDMEDENQDQEDPV